MASPITYNLRSVMAMGWVHARMGARKFGGSPRLYLAAALKQAWAEEKAMKAQTAARGARFAASARLGAQLNDLERERLERMAGRTATYSFQRGTITGRHQGGRW